MKCKAWALVFFLLFTVGGRAIGQPPVISYNPASVTYTVNTPTTPLIPHNNGGAIPTTAYGAVTILTSPTRINGYVDGPINQSRFEQADGLAHGPNGDLYIADVNNNVIRRVNSSNLVTTFVGTAAGLHFPTDLVFDAAGNLYVTDFGSHSIKKITPAGVVTTFAGNGAPGFQNGVGTGASFSGPLGITIDATGNLYVADSDNEAIRKITPNGTVSTFANNSGSYGYADGPAAGAKFQAPGSLYMDPSGTLYVLEHIASRIRMISPAGIVSTMTVNNTSAFISGPRGMVVAPSGNIYFSNYLTNEIVLVTPDGKLSVVASGLDVPRHLVIDNNGNLIVSIQNGLAGIALNGYSIDKPLPAGLIFDATTGQISGTPTVASPPTTYTVTAYNRDGSSSTTIQIAVNAATVAAPNITYPTPLVYNTNIVITSATPTNTGGPVLIAGYSIDKPLPAGLTFDINTGIISGTPTTVTAPADYTVTATNAGGSSSFKINIEVKAVLLPSIITFPLIPQNSIDANNNLTPSATSTNNETPIIYSSDNPLVAIITANGLIHLVGPGVAHITASQVGNNHYSAATPVMQTLTVIEYQHLLFPPIAVKTTCAADFPLNVTSTSSSTIPIVYTSSNPNVASVSVNGTVHIMSAGTTTITANQAGSPLYDPAEPQTQILTVIAPATPTLAVTPGTYSSCLGLPVTYTATATNAGSNPVYQWVVNSVKMPGQNGTSFTSSTLHTNDIIACTLTSTDICGVTTTVTSNTASIIADPYITPTIAIQANTTMPVCVGTAVSFTATATNQGTSPSYQWQVNGTNAGTGQPTFTSTTLNNGDKVTCVLTLQNGKCMTALVASSNAIFAQITPNQNPAIIVTTPVTTVFGGTRVTFTATTNAGTGAVYQWQVNGVNTGTNSSTFTTSTLQNGDAVTCMVSGGAGCITPVTSLPLIMTVNSPTSIPIVNTFTPNGDGINDVWNITALAFFPDCLVNVYNRFGALVFQSKGYSQPWDGALNGKAVPAGTYYYVIDLGVAQPKLSGSVTILR